MTIYLYVKTHNKTGLKYLGQTSAKDPHKYRGSGKRWTNHIKKHGYDVVTEILRECKTNEEIKEWGLYYSNLWGVVESDEWANLKAEEGDGWASGKHNPACLIKNKKFGDDNVSKRKDVREKISGNNHYMKKSTFDPERHNSKNPNTIQKRSGYNHWMKKGSYDPSWNPEYDPTIYTFANEKLNLIVNMTKTEFRKKYKLNSGSVSKLAAKKVKSCHGWRLVD